MKNIKKSKKSNKKICYKAKKTEFSNSDIENTVESFSDIMNHYERFTYLQDGGWKSKIFGLAEDK